MTIARDGTGSGKVGVQAVTQLVITFTTNANRHLVVAGGIIDVGAGTATSVVCNDSASGSWTTKQIKSTIGAGANIDFAFVCFRENAGAITSATITFNNGDGFYGQAALDQWTGVATSGSFDQMVTAEGAVSTNAWGTGNLTAGDPNCLIYGAADGDDSSTTTWTAPGAPWTEIYQEGDTNSTHASETIFQIASGSTGPFSATFTYLGMASGAFAGASILVSFLPAGGGAPPAASAPFKTIEFPGFGPRITASWPAFKQGQAAPPPPDPATNIPKLVSPQLTGPGKRFFPEFRQGVPAPTPPPDPATWIPRSIFPGRGPGNRFFPDFVQGSPATIAGNTYTLSPGGTLTFSGTLNLLRERQLVPTGSIVFSSSAGFLRERILVPVGSIVFSGVAALLRTRLFTPSGQIVFSGTAPISNSGVFTLSPSGSIVFSGSALLLRIRQLIVGGILAFSGTATFFRTRAQVPSGTLNFSGGQTQSIRTKVFPTAGSILFSGSAPISFAPAGAIATGNQIRRMGFGSMQ